MSKRRRMGKVGLLRRLIAKRNGVHFSEIPKKRKELLKLAGISSKNFSLERDDFYKSAQWTSLKKEVLNIYGRMCMKCHTLDAEFHVDHIKPRSFYPELELDINNLQILCRSCNKHKSNKNEIDYRPSDLHTWKSIQHL